MRRLKPAATSNIRQRRPPSPSPPPLGKGSASHSCLSLSFGSFVWSSFMKKLQSGDEVVKVDEQLGIAWILLPPDERLKGFRGISPRIMDEEKFLAAKKKAEQKKD